MNTTSRLCSLLLFAVTTGCALLHEDSGSNGSAISGKPPASTLTLSLVSATKTTITVNVCAGETGAPAGFSLHWIEASLLPSDGKWPESDELCHGSFSGNAHASRFELIRPNSCATVEVGALDEEPGASFSCNSPLECGTEYAFRAFAHANSTLKRSEWSPTFVTSTSACDEGCTYTQGYWKNHTPWATKTSLQRDWPLLGVPLGMVTYLNPQIGQIFETPVKGNGLVALAHQLAAAKLNIANGASSTAISSTITAADALIGWKTVPSVGSGYLEPSSTSALVTALANFNEGVTGPGHCAEEDYSTASAAAMQPLE